MKLTNIEKLMICVCVLIFFIFGFFTYLFFDQLDKAGGLKEVIIQSGKEIKDIKNKIIED